MKYEDIIAKFSPDMIERYNIAFNVEEQSLSVYGHKHRDYLNFPFDRIWKIENSKEVLEIITDLVQFMMWKLCIQTHTTIFYHKVPVIPKNAKNNQAKKITVEIYGGCLTEVSNLPPGYDYELIDHDCIESDEEERKKEERKVLEEK